MFPRNLQVDKIILGESRVNKYLHFTKWSSELNVQPVSGGTVFENVDEI